jgi:hypothetical protein
MPRFLVATAISPDAGGECASREWRLRAATGELRRRGLAVLFDRAIPVVGEGRCLFVLVAVSKGVVECAAELAQLGAIDVVEAGAPTASVA